MAVERGIAELAITDHIDFDPRWLNYNPRLRDPRADRPRPRPSAGAEHGVAIRFGLEVSYESSREDEIREHLRTPRLRLRDRLGPRQHRFAVPRLAGAQLGGRTEPRRDRRAVVRRGDRCRAERAVRHDRPPRLDQALPPSARCAGPARRSAGPLRGDAHRPRRERNRPRGEHERAAPGHARDVPLAPPSSPASASSAASGSRPARMPTGRAGSPTASMPPTRSRQTRASRTSPSGGDLVRPVSVAIPDRFRGPMKLTVIGAGPAYTDRAGAVGASYLVTSGSTTLLLDLGHGSFANLAGTLEPSTLTAIAISHLHPDHFIDLVPLRHYLRYEFEPPRRVTVLAPGAIAQRLDALLAQPGFTAESLDIVAISDGLPARDRRAAPRGAQGHPHRRFVRVPGQPAALGGETAPGRGLVYSGDCGRAADLRPADPARRRAPLGGVVRAWPGPERCVPPRCRRGRIDRRPRPAPAGSCSPTCSPGATGRRPRPRRPARQAGSRRRWSTRAIASSI